MRMSTKSYFHPCDAAVFAVYSGFALSLCADQKAASVTNFPFNLLTLTA